MYPRRGHQVELDEQLSLSDQDVNILLQIVSRAEKQPDAHRLPFRAIFAAYDSVLSENGIEAETDRTYLRFLFQLGGKSVPGDTLYEKFETLLLRMGIELEYGDETGGEGGRIEEVTTADTEANGALAEEKNTGRWQPTRYPVHGGQRARRASFNSMYDAVNETTQRSMYRPSSRSSVSRLEVGRRIFSPPPIRREELARHAHAPAIVETRSRMTANRATKNTARRHPQTGAIITEPAQLRVDLDAHHLNHGVNENKTTNHTNQKRLLFDSSEESNDEPLQHGDLIPGVQVPPELIYQPSLSHLLRDASTFNMYRQRGTVRRIFAKWSERAKRQQQTFESMQKAAAKHDASTLQRQAFDIWRTTWRQKRQEAQTARFFKHLEKRAARARDLYLMTKAFTHWAQVTSDEVEKASEARRHILCIKYFNAWRGITAVNEMKAQRLALTKPFKAWKTKFKQFQKDDAEADAVYQENLARSAYWKWFWTFCDRRAPQWRDYRLKHKSLLSWLRALRTQRERDQEIDVHNKQTLLQATFQKWSQRMRAIISAQQHADSRWKLEHTGHCFSEWRIRTHLEPIAVKVSASVESRILHSSIKTWALQSRMSKHAREVDRLRIMCNTWTTWNDNLRCLALSSRINERVVMQALYKWVLMARVRLMSRIHEQRVKRETLARLTLNSRGLYTRLLRQEEDFRAHRSRELLRSKLYDWREKLATQRRRDHVALVYYAPRLEQETLDAWKNQMRHVSELESWAKDARFYFLMTGYLKQWRVAAANSAKKRRQDAYAKVRRTIKMNLASGALSALRSKAVTNAKLEHHADDIRWSRLFKLGIDAFDKWRAATARRRVNVRDSEIFYSRQLAYSCLTRMSSLFTRIRALDEKAIQFQVIHVSASGATQLRKLSLRIFQIKASLETADALNERNLRKHLRNMFRHWYGKAKRLLDGRHGDIHRYPTIGASYDNITTTPRRPNEGWPLVDPILSLSELGPLPHFTAQTPIATPGYLNSPSKRAARAKALAQVSTTPATPIRTPFAARLRAEQVRTEPRQFLHNRTSVHTRRSSLGAIVRFADEAVDDNDDYNAGDDIGDADDDGEVGDEPESPTKRRSTNRSI
ncbi:centrin-binding protein Sfi1 [Histoplasma capsulatum var. duboisii H88]|uniref:Centrin-binding protein Sfi1 n=1 Tax=Ajellomyces capsulatus (strain H88) TaxID=544711 RepID=A0A8A1LCQ9_AJEC8|nr:centrin-binding protein Sfi1 [Histoplasma capsulatum var. duboisii H88]